ncbi:MAG: PrsW family intramembrane metalloprotease [Myxococcales bacterium]|nr:PrsW family intramembrane metalloprotease [Myxococcales bacterium]
MGIVTILWAFLPAFLWLYVIYKKDKHEPEPFKQIVKVYLVGMLATIPAIVINTIGGQLLPAQNRDLGQMATMMFGIVGPNEEFWKFLFVYWMIAKSKEFDEPMDGIVYACTGALGFAGLENVLYVAQHGAGVVVLRAFTAVPMHFLASGIVGYALGKRRFGHGGIPVPLALVIAAMMHGLYDFCAFGTAITGNLALFGGLIVIVIAQGFWFRSAIKRLLALSPFRPEAEPDFCDSCGELMPKMAAACAKCGTPAPTSEVVS